MVCVFPKVVDHHKKNRPLVPNGLGIVYVFASVLYLSFLYLLSSFGVFGFGYHALVLMFCVLFGGFIGVCDDWLDLRWRYKALLPLVIALPLNAFLIQFVKSTFVDTLFFGACEFGVMYYLLFVPSFITIATNTINQLGGLNGLETIPPLVIMVGLMVASKNLAVLIVGPLLVLFVFATFNFRGKLFVGNVGSFSLGATLAVFALIANLKTFLLIALTPYIFNSALILFSYFANGKKASVKLAERGLTADSRKSLATTILYHRQLSERMVVIIISLFTVVSTLIALLLS